jgi:hypothetical protein
LFNEACHEKVGFTPLSKVISKFVYWLKYTVIPWYTSLGVTKGTLTLEVLGRKTGNPTHVSLTTVNYNRSRYLVSLYDKRVGFNIIMEAAGSYRGL